MLSDPTESPGQLLDSYFWIRPVPSASFLEADGRAQPGGRQEGLAERGFLYILKPRDFSPIWGQSRVTGGPDAAKTDLAFPPGFQSRRSLTESQQPPEASGASRTRGAAR